MLEIMNQILNHHYFYSAILLGIYSIFTFLTNLILKTFLRFELLQLPRSLEKLKTKKRIINEGIRYIKLKNDTVK
jgi:hypothetical protein